MLDVAVIIVTWNVRELILDALESLYTDLESSGLSAEVHVVDSASSDGTPQAVASAFPQVKLTASPDNLGFAGGNNYALRQIGFGPNGISDDDLPRAVYLLNPDTITHPGATRALFDVLLGDGLTGLVGARLSYDDGSFQHSAFRFPGLRQLWVELFPVPGRLIESSFNGRYPRIQYEQSEPFPIEFPLGATMMLRREVIQQTGMFDEEFFMYCEEIDWAWRIHKAGWNVMCVPSAHVTHLAGQSTSQVRPSSLVNLWTSRLRLYRKHYAPWKYAVARHMIRIGMQRKIREMENGTSTSSLGGAALADAYRQIEALARS